MSITIQLLIIMNNYEEAKGKQDCEKGYESYEDFLELTDTVT